MFTRRQFFHRSILGTAGLAATGITGMIGCRSSVDTPDPAKRTSAGSSSKFIMQASWVNDAEFSGYFTAIDRGYYRDLGLDLEYRPGGPDLIPESILLGKRADVALTTPDTTIKLIVKDRAPLKIIAAQYQKSPLGIVSLAKNHVQKPADLVGKTLAVPPVNMLSVEALLKLNGVPKDRVKIVPYQYDPTPLLKGDVDATVDFVTNVPFTIEQAGGTPTSFLMFDFGFTIYNDTVVVTEATLKSRRAELIRWLRASRRGWTENLADPAKYPPTFAQSWFKGNGRTLSNEIYFNKAQKPLIESPAGIFAMTEQGIQGNIRALQEIGISATRDMFATDLLAEL